MNNGSHCQGALRVTVRAQGEWVIQQHHGIQHEKQGAVRLWTNVYETAVSPRLSCRVGKGASFFKRLASLG
jgi:hypothetical protein